MHQSCQPPQDIYYNMDLLRKRDSKPKSTGSTKAKKKKNESREVLPRANPPPTIGEHILLKKNSVLSTSQQLFLH